MVTNERGEIVRESSCLEPGQQIAVFFQRGRADASVLAVAEDAGIELAAGSIASTASRE